QREERLGWTGDIAAYAATAAYQFDVSDFLHNWLLDVHAEASLPPLSFVPCVVPDTLKLRAGRGGRLSHGGPNAGPTANTSVPAGHCDSPASLRSWLLGVHAEASLPPLSFVPVVVPDILELRAGGADPFSAGEPKEVPTAIWGDAAVWVAEALWNAYGDLDRL